jgi:hypothetical protein
MDSKVPNATKPASKDKDQPRDHRNDASGEMPRVEDLPPRRPADDRRDSVDMVNRPGPGERDDAERPLLDHDSEAQNGGRTMEEELTILSSDDDAGALPNQQLQNRGPIAGDEGRRVPPRSDE